MARATKTSLIAGFTKNANNAAFWITGELENAISDGYVKEEDSVLHNHDGLVELVYNSAIENRFTAQGCDDRRANKEWRFLGREILIPICESAVAEYGY